jgi:hypothetical protein
VRSGAILGRISCAGGAGTCDGTIVLRTTWTHKTHSGRWLAITLASGSFAIPQDHTATVRLRLSAQGKALLVRHRTLLVRVTTSTRQATGIRSQQALLTLRAGSMPRAR